MYNYVRLTDRAFIAISGPDRLAFLQGLVTQNVDTLSAQRPLLYSALLSPQGKYLYDFFLWHKNESILLEADAPRRDELLALLGKYKLRKNVTLTPHENDVFQIFGKGDALSLTPDPRLAELGYRSLEKPELPEVSLEKWIEYRLHYNVPDCPQDMRIGLSTPFEGNIDLLNGIDFNKGCYMGQEMVSRIHHRGLVKRRFPNLKD